MKAKGTSTYVWSMEVICPL